MESKKCIKRYSKYSFVRFMEDIILQLHENGQYKSCQHYQATLNSFLRFRKNRDLSLRRLNATVLIAYEAYLKQQSLCRNTISFYMRILRAVYYRAVEQGIIVQRHPFRHVYTGIDKTHKRAIPFESVKKIKQLDLHHSPAADMARDVFLMSFFLRGISLVDLAYLKKSDIRNGFLRYVRSKTCQPLVIRWEPQMQELVDKYRHLGNNTPYLFPILQSKGRRKKPHQQLYHNAEARISYHLRKIREQAGIKENLTLYVARHSWATVAKEHHYPISVISEALGHDSENTTKIYLNSIRSSEVDELNAEILSEL